MLWPFVTLLVFVAFLIAAVAAVRYMDAARRLARRPDVDANDFGALVADAESWRARDRRIGRAVAGGDAAMYISDFGRVYAKPNDTQAVGLWLADADTAVLMPRAHVTRLVAVLLAWLDSDRALTGTRVETLHAFVIGFGGWREVYRRMPAEVVAFAARLREGMIAAHEPSDDVPLSRDEALAIARHVFIRAWALWPNFRNGIPAEQVVDTLDRLIVARDAGELRALLPFPCRAEFDSQFADACAEAMDFGSPSTPPSQAVTFGGAFKVSQQNGATRFDDLRGDR